MLNDKTVRELKPESKAYRAKDAGGLFLDVRPSGNKFWRITYRDSRGKVQTKTIGQWPSVSLVAAPAELSNLRLQVERGADQSGGLGDPSMTFGQLAREWFDLKRKGWKPKYQTRVWGRILTDAFPDLEHRPIGSVTSAELLAVLRKIEARGVMDASKRLRQQMEDMWALAMVTGRAENNPASGLQRAMAPSPKTQNYLRLTARQLPEFFRRLSADENMHEGTRLGLRCLIPRFDGAILSLEWKDALWDKFVMAAPRPRTLSEQQ